MDELRIEDILSAQADRLNQGQRDSVALPEKVDELAVLMQLAEQAQRALAPVEPSPAFVNHLGRQLVSKMSDGSRQMSRQARRAVLIVAAALGSVVSVLSAIGIVIYLIRHRNRRFPVQS
jgi:hypothetical protein